MYFKKTVVKIIALLIALTTFTSLISVSALQNFDNVIDMNTGASVSASTINSTYSTLSNKVTAAVNNAQSKISQLYDLDTELINEYISQAQSELNKANSLKNSIVNNINGSNVESYITDFYTSKTRIEELCTLIEVSLVESKVISARSTWYRPCEKTFAQMKETVETFKSAGINLIFLETFFHGCSAFKTDISDIPYHPDLVDTYTDTESNIVYNDYLSAFVALCTKYGIEVHAWTENFYVGVNANTNIVKQHPDWVMYNDDGTFLQRKEGGQYIFIDPANEEVQNLLINYYNDLFEKHPDVKGLNLDYIRYPVSNRSMDTGFAPGAMKGFYELLGKKFTAEQLADSKKMRNKFLQLFNKDYLQGGQAEADQNYELWCEYRKQVITDFVLRIKNEVKEPNKIVLSTAVFATISESLDSKKQDWQTWFKNGWIEIATPMAYYSSATTVKNNVKTMIGLGGNKCLYYTGIASSYSGLPAYENKNFVTASYEAGACGYVIFSGAQIVGHKDVQDVLSSGINNKWAVLPHASIDKILEASFGDILSKVDRIYIPAGAMTAGQRTNLENEMAEIQKMPFAANDDIAKICDSIEDVLNSLSQYSSGYAKTRISDDLTYLLKILEARSVMPIIVEEDTTLPDDGGNGNEGNVPDNDGTVDDNESDNENDNENEENNGDKEGTTAEAPVKLGFFERFILAIVNFLKKLFGLA